MASKRKNKGKRTITIKGSEVYGREARTATEQAWANRMARIDRNQRREALETKEAMA